MSACYCIGPQNGEPLCPCRMKGIYQKDGRWIEPGRDLGPVRKSIDDIFDDYRTKPKKQSGLVPLPESYQPCSSPNHGPPNMMVVPPGHVYIHICDACGHESRIYPSPIRM